MKAVLDVVLIVLQLFTYVLIGAAILSWLIGFNVVNYSNNVVRSIWDMLHAVSEPVLRPIRSRLPDMGGVDISPVIAILGIILLERLIVYYIYPNVF